MVLNTPRSIEACRAEGIDPTDMSIVEITEFGKEFAPETEESVIEQSVEDSKHESILKITAQKQPIQQENEVIEVVQKEVKPAPILVDGET